jgi:hypothetical protein
MLLTKFYFLAIIPAEAIYSENRTKSADKSDFEKLKNEIPGVEIIWGDEDNDSPLFLEKVEWNDEQIYNRNFCFSETNNSYPMIPFGTRIQAAEIWNASNRNVKEPKTFTTATISAISDVSSSGCYKAGEPTDLNRSEVFPKRNFVLGVKPGIYLLAIHMQISPINVSATYTTIIKQTD